MNLATFKTQCPEFANAGDAFLQAYLDEATKELDVAVWGAKFDTAHKYLTAHKLALSPYGQNARLVAKDGSTTYGKQYETLQMQVAYGYRVP